MTTPDNKPTSELRQQITCITGECPAGHEGCIYIDYKNYDAFRTPKTDKILALLAAQKQRWEAEARRQEAKELISIIWDTDGSHYYKDDVPHEVLEHLTNLEAIAALDGVIGETE